MKQPFSMLVRKKHLGVIVEKTWKPLAQFRTAIKAKAKEVVLLLHDALVGCLISEFFTSTTKSEGPVQLGQAPTYPKGESLFQSV